jgi:vacuolar-type H+-ATPase subunit H
MEYYTTAKITANGVDSPSIIWYGYDMKDLVSLIIEAEREIADNFRKEKSRIERWVEEKKKEINEELALREGNLEKETMEIGENIKRDAQKKAEELLEKARNEACRLRDMREDVLKEIVLKYIKERVAGSV